MIKIINWLDYFLAFIDIVVRVFIYCTTLFILSEYSFVPEEMLKGLSIIFFLWICIPALNVINLKNISNKLKSERDKDTEELQGEPK